MDQYKTIKKNGTSLYKVKGSKHLGYAFGVNSKEQIEEILNQIKNEHKGANHHCYAWALGINREPHRFNDDGEPSGSAGKPIYGQILSFELTNVFIVVVRYFGGTKLGVGGLIDAYRTAAKLAIDNSTIIEKFICDYFRITYPYTRVSDVNRIFKGFSVEPEEQSFEMDCSCKVGVPLSDSERFQSEINFEDVKLTYLNTY